MRLAARAKCGGEIFSDFLWAVALDKTGRAGACGRGGVRTRFGPENCDAASGTRRPTEAAAKRPAAPGSLGGHLEQPREVDATHAEDARDVAKLPWAPPKAAGKDKAPGPLFHGRSVLRRVRIARAAAAEEQRRLPLQKVGAGTLSLEWAMRLDGKGPAALRRGVAQRAPVAGTAFIQPRAKVENWRGRSQSDGEGQCHFRSVEKTYEGFGSALRRCRREGRRTEKALRRTAEG
ncbi:hypothetical protein ERJ75_001613500 [Trypanosoma vivax]|nr:hypothetical protein ERJ75_001613900 [Trypanosoma vivax]KAH8605712.1 hypothetical protein ERJ75_001613700 [Trypanosoma vivax]KAH8605759.1 hypothetical protein ERJ75_001613500 [Trypanosoma vivax]